METFTASGTKEFSVAKTAEFTVAVAGNFGTPNGGTPGLSIQYLLGDTWRPFLSGETGLFESAGERVFINCGSSGVIRAVLVNSANPDLDVLIQITREVEF